MALPVKNPPASVGDRGDPGSVPGSGGSPGGGNGSPLQSSCLENPMDRGAWQVWSVGSQSRTRGAPEHTWTQEEQNDPATLTWDAAQILSYLERMLFIFSVCGSRGGLCPSHHCFFPTSPPVPPAVILDLLSNT